MLNIFIVYHVFHDQYLQKYREGLLVGSACDKGEVFEGMMQKSPEEVEEIAQFYDYIEVHLQKLRHLIESELVRDEGQLKKLFRTLVKLGEKLESQLLQQEMCII